MSARIAVVGMACEYPDASSPAALWANVVSQRRSFRRIPDTRLNLADYQSNDPGAADKTYAAYASVLTDYSFDRLAHRVGGVTYRSTDLTHWLALDVAGRTLRDAGEGLQQLINPERVGVIVGNTLTGEFSRSNVLRLRWPYVRHAVSDVLEGRGVAGSDLEDLLTELESVYKEPFAEVTADSLAGGLSNVIAGRICNYFDFGGGGYTVDGACSSSLLAVMNGADALCRGDLDLALVGGVDLSMDPFELVGFSKAAAIAPNLMSVYDTHSSGFWPGEGCGFVALMREDDADRLNCRTYAVLGGWGISSDGAGGTTRPEAKGQLLALRRAYERADWDPASVTSYEGHGTGTPVGDATELDALSTLRGSEAPSAYIGSIKANIGHTKAASGLAGLMKSVLSLHHQVLPPITGCTSPVNQLDGEHQLSVLREPTPWPIERALRVGVSSMGFGGINTHIALESNNARKSSRSALLVGASGTPQDAELLVLAGASTSDVANRARELATSLRPVSMGELRDFAIAQGREVTDGRVRAAVIIAGPHDATDQLTELADRLDRHSSPADDADPLASEAASSIDVDARLYVGVGETSGRVALLFPGQAAPTRLKHGAIGRRFADLTQDLPLPARASAVDLSDTAIAQPAITAGSILGARVLESLGIHPQRAVGHSVGEIAALHWAGAYDAATALHLATVRGQVMADLPGDHGLMAELRTSHDVVIGLIDRLPVVVAAENGPDRIVVAGQTQDVKAVTDRARSRGIRANELQVSHAFHSPLMADAIPPFAEALANVDMSAPERELWSTVRGERLSPGTDTRSLLTDQVLAPVQFEAAVNGLADDSDLLIEVGPGRVFGTMAAETVGLPVLSLDVGSESVRGLLDVVAAAFVLGLQPDRKALNQGRVAASSTPPAAHRYLENPCERRAPYGSSNHALLSLEPVVAAGGNLSRPGSIAPAPNEARKPRTTVESPKPARDSGPGTDPEHEPIDIKGTLELVQEIVAERAELPISSVAPHASLLADLALNSITVAEVAAEAAHRLGVRAALAPSELAAATVGDLAALLDASAAADPAEGIVAGVESWVRSLEEVWVPAQPPTTPRRPQVWKVQAAPGEDSNLVAEVAAIFGTDGTAGSDNVLVIAPGTRSSAAAIWLIHTLAAAKDAGANRIALLHTGQSGAALKALAYERPEIITRLLTVPGLRAPVPRSALTAARIAAESGRGYRELRVGQDGALETFSLRPVSTAPQNSEAPAPSGVVLVAGGSRGIGAACAAALARAAACPLALVGRSHPDHDDQLAAELARLTELGIQHRYYVADLTDAAAITKLIETVQADLGEITGWLHGTGLNRPGGISELTAAAIGETVAAKITTFELLAEHLPDTVRNVWAFGSIIGRIGLHGEAHYGLANEWLAAAVEHEAGRRPNCGFVMLEWSVWSGTGMGERLDVLESLARTGVTPITVDAGISAFLAAVRSCVPGTHTRRVVTSRYGQPPTLPDERPALPLRRFLEQPRIYVPGIELVADAALSFDTDRYLLDHQLDGRGIVPAVVGLEAMAQVTEAVTGCLPRAFTDLRWDQPVAVTPSEPTILRIAALVRDEQHVDLVVRSSTTGFGVDHFRATAELAAPVALITQQEQRPDGSGELPPELYAHLLFHGRLFHRLTAVYQAHAAHLDVDVQVDNEASWFAPYLPQELLLGDLGSRDAFLHAAQATIPRRRFVPIRADRIDLMKPFGGTLRVVARQVWHVGQQLQVDVSVIGEDGGHVEAWTGLVLSEIEPLPEPAAWSPLIAGAMLERHLEELDLPGWVRVGLAVGQGDPSNQRSLALYRAAGSALLTVRRTDGKPESTDPAIPFVSLADSGGLTVAVVADQGIGVDVEMIQDRSLELWERLIGSPLLGIARQVAQEVSEPTDVTATRIWAALECLHKAGSARDTPVIFERSLGEGGVLLRSGGVQILTVTARVIGIEDPLVLAVAIDTATHEPPVAAPLAGTDVAELAR